MKKPPALTLISRPSTSQPLLPCSADTVRASLAALMKSRHFVKAVRCTALLTYLVERAIVAGDAAPPPEQEVGVAVFGRDPDSYFPCDDPIVRVQAGRLRVRLAAYYDEEGGADPLRFTVPAGRYQACIALAEERRAPSAPEPALLMLRPLVCLDAGGPGHTFATGFSAELECRLYGELLRVASPLRLGSTGSGAGQRPSHLLEGSVRQDATRLRISLQLRDAEQGMLLWCAQFDGAAGASIDSQQQLAERCVLALMPHMPQIEEVQQMQQMQQTALAAAPAPGYADTCG